MVFSKDGFLLYDKEIGDKALSLANPSKPRAMRLHNPRDYYEEVTLLSMGIWSDNSSGRSVFGYQVDEEKFDSGSLVIVEYVWNSECSECVENKALEDDEGLAAETLYNNVLRDFKLTSLVTRITLETIGGHLTFQVDGLEDVISYPPIPPGLNIPTISISDLRRASEQIPHSCIDLVIFEGLYYAFKRYSFDPDERRSDPDTGEDLLLKELKHLIQFDSAFILKPSFLVIDTAVPSCARGFLAPFYPANSLNCVLLDLRRDGSSSEQEWPDLSSKQPVVPLEISAISTRTSLLAWPLKLIWSIDITSDLVALHDVGSYCGDIKMDNILLGTDGHLRLIDVLPVSGYSMGYAPPELAADLCSLPLTAARDVFGLGLVLWALSEEFGHFRRQDISTEPRLVWGNGKGAPPQWFRELVESCVVADPLRRPSAVAVLQVLESHFMHSN